MSETAPRIVESGLAVVVPERIDSTIESIVQRVLVMALESKSVGTLKSVRIRVLGKL